MDFYSCVAAHHVSLSAADVHFALLHEFARLVGPALRADHPVIVAWMKEAVDTSVKVEDWASQHPKKLMRLAEDFFDFHAASLTNVMRSSILALLAVEVYDCQIGFTTLHNTIDWFCPRSIEYYFCDIDAEAPTIVLTPLKKKPGYYSFTNMKGGGGSAEVPLLLLSKPHPRFTLRMTRAGVNKKVSEFTPVSATTFEAVLPDTSDVTTTFQVYPGDPNSTFYDFKNDEFLVLSRASDGQEIARTYAPEIYLYFRSSPPYDRKEKVILTVTKAALKQEN